MDPIDLDPPAPRSRWSAPCHGTPIVHLPTRTTGTVEKFANRPVLVRDRAGRVHRFTVVPGEFAVDGVACEPVVGSRPARRPGLGRAVRCSVGTGLGSLGPAGSWSRASTTPSCSRRSGATTSATRASWSSGSTAPTTCGAVVSEFRPGPQPPARHPARPPGRGSKESRIAASVDHPHVLVTGTPYIDVWQAVRPSVAGIDAWPDVPMGESWKEGVSGASAGPTRTRASSGGSCWPGVDLCRPVPAPGRRRRAAHRLRDRARGLRGPGADAGQKVRTLSASATRRATSGGLTAVPQVSRSSSVAPRATAQPFQTKTGTSWRSRLLHELSQPAGCRSPSTRSALSPAMMSVLSPARIITVSWPSSTDPFTARCHGSDALRRMTPPY